MAQIRQEANEGRELGGLGRANDYGQGQGQGPPQAKGRGVRMPSEANPWDDVSSDSGAGHTKDISTGSNWDVDPWGNRMGMIQGNQATPAPVSLDRLSLMDDPRTSRGPSPKPQLPQSIPIPQKIRTQTKEEKELEEAALGGDQKAWDPLGAL